MSQRDVVPRLLIVLIMWYEIAYIGMVKKYEIYRISCNNRRGFLKIYEIKVIGNIINKG